MTTQELEHCDTADAVLAYARSSRAARDQAEVDLYEATIAWAVMHSTFDDRQAVGAAGTDMMIELAGLGAPKVSEFAIVEYGTALGCRATPRSATSPTCVEIRYRLPRLHAQVISGRVPVWRAGRIAEATLGPCRWRVLRSSTSTSPPSPRRCRTPGSTASSRRPAPGSTPRKPKNSA